jgi:hypothetical protein
MVNNKIINILSLRAFVACKNTVSSRIPSTCKQLLVSGHPKESNIYVPRVYKDFITGLIKRLLNYFVTALNQIL